MIKTKMKNKNAGFTLLEVILSIAILAVISIPLMKYFSDSLRHTAFAGRKQKATLVAQETLEYIKAQDRIMVQSSTAPVDPSATPAFTWELAPALQTKFAVGESDSGDLLTGYDPSEGKGLMVYKYVDDSDPDLAGFDILVSLYTDVSANDVTKPINYGINDTASIVASESMEQTQALAYFVTRNIMANSGVIDPYVDPYVSASPAPTTGPLPTYDPFGGVTPTPAPTAEPSTSPDPSAAPVVVPLLSEAEIAELMERDIHVEIDRPTGTYYTINVYYEYRCAGIVGPGEDAVTYTIYDDSIDDLEGIYLMFNQVKTNDKVIVDWLPLTQPEKQIVLRMVCQNLSASPVDEWGATILYNPVLELTGFGPGTYPDIKTNILDGDGDSNISCSLIGATEMSNLVEGDSSVRTFDVTVSVYKKGALNSDLSTTQDPLAEMVTTKVE